MYPIYYAIIIIVCLIALFGTINVARDLVRQEKEDDSTTDELTSLKEDRPVRDSSVRLLTMIYTITFIISIILMWIFVF
ncbi:hypothetical protein LF817_02110 [Halobacillus sp. A1]|uniref:hypothetical protein n=1 Tax=Halobacillus sp. A1 TaxID=2880262 RepID=UPI0020A62A41|nr:hypothetical protein [Halobacillus sp. A1]MCP3030130.1 hypothetical protein [Halobacillus sp. A1]